MTDAPKKLDLITARNLKNLDKLHQLTKNFRKQSNYRVYGAACDENEEELAKEEFEEGKNLVVFVGLLRSRLPGQFKEKDVHHYYTRKGRRSSMMAEWLINRKDEGKGGRVHKLFTHKVDGLQDGWNLQTQLILNVKSLSECNSAGMEPLNKTMRLVHTSLMQEVLYPLWEAKDKEGGIEFNPFSIVQNNDNPSPPNFSIPSPIQIHHPVNITEKFEFEEQEQNKEEESMEEDEDDDDDDISPDLMCRQF